MLRIPPPPMMGVCYEVGMAGRRVVEKKAARIPIPIHFQHLLDGLWHWPLVLSYCNNSLWACWYGVFQLFMGEGKAW